MTRDEAIAKVLAVVGSERSRTIIANDIDTLITLGLLKVDEVKPVTVRDLAISAAERALEIPYASAYHAAHAVIDEINRAGITLRIGFTK